MRERLPEMEGFPHKSTILNFGGAVAAVCARGAPPNAIVELSDNFDIGLELSDTGSEYPKKSNTIYPKNA